MASYKEIVTKAVIGKAKKTTTSNFSLTPNEKPDTVLGCWVINHSFRGRNNQGAVEINGEFDVNVWYSYENDSKTTVVNKKIDYNDLLNVKTKDNVDLTGDTDIIVRSLKQPTCSKVNIGENGVINFDIEKELGVEIVGETKMKIAIEDEEDPWDEIDDEVTEEVEKEIENNVTEDYIK